MAITERDSPALSDLASQNETLGVAGSDAVAEGGTKKDSSTVPSLESQQPQQQAPNRPSLVPLGSSQSTTITHKKFSAVNIGKKFLEKNAQSAAAAAASTTSSNTTGAKTSAATGEQKDLSGSEEIIVLNMLQIQSGLWLRRRLRIHDWLPQSSP
jgi:hypothetical protein